MIAVDLFAGPGGWDHAARSLGIEPLGVEWDSSACATREAAGLRTLQGDVFHLDPLEIAGGAELLIGSPPCPTFSNAGGGAGHRVVDLILGCMEDLCDGVDSRLEMREQAYVALLPGAIADERAKCEKRGREFRVEVAEAKARREADTSLLVCEPLRWILAVRPALIALEQVPPVLPLWEQMRDAFLPPLGYRAWAGTLSAEQYGVPQTRERAILLASSRGPVRPPAPTHRRFVSLPREPEGQDSLFDAGPRGRIVVRGEEGLTPWVSMAEALGWGMTARPTVTVTAGSNRQGGSDPLDGGTGARRAIQEEKDAGRFVVKTRGEDGSRPNDVYDADDQPSRALTGKTYSWLVGGNQEKATERAEDEPAPTLAFGHAMNDVRFIRRERSGDRAEEGFDPGESPAQALTSKTRSWEVIDGRSGEFNRGPVDTEEQPSPTVTSTTRQWTLRTGDNTMTASRDLEDMVPYERSVDEPSPTLTAKAGGAWKVAPEGEHVDPPMRFKRNSADGPEWAEERPATTVHGDPRLYAPHGHDESGFAAKGGGTLERHGPEWSEDRPATVLQGDARVFTPGSHIANDGRDLSKAKGRSEDAVRISVEEASILQGFPPDYPWTGSRTKMFEQIGNAVPPPLARAVLAALIEEEE